jgi:C4-dicarboxylate-binding protein DctP
MKKLLATVLAILTVLCLALTGCGSTSAGSSSANSSGAAGSAADGKVYTLKWAHVSPASGDKQADAVLETIAKIKDESNGRLIIEHYPASELGSEAEIFEGIQMGTIEIGTLSCGSLTGFVPELSSTTIPFLFKSREQAWDFFDSDTADWLAQKVYDETGVKVMGWAENGLRCFSTTKHQIKTPTDLKGLKIRTQQNPVTMAMVTAMGGSPQPIDFSELYTSLQQGAVDGQENPPSLIYTQGLYEVTPYLTLDYHVYDFLGVFMNENTLNSLPDDLRQILVSNLSDFVTNERQKSSDYDARDIKTMQDKGVTVYTPTDEEHQAFVDSTASVVDTVKGVAGNEAVEKVMAQVQALND